MIRDHLLVIVGGPNTRPTNPSWRTASILKNPLNRHICKRLTDFDEIWQGDAHWLPTENLPLVWNFAKSKMTAATILKEKYKNRDIPATARWIFTKFGTVMQNGWISKIEDGGRPVFWKPLNHHISATVDRFW